MRMMRRHYRSLALFGACLLSAAPAPVLGFLQSCQHQKNAPFFGRITHQQLNAAASAGKGFGKSSSDNNNNNNKGFRKTYGERELVKDVIDSETAMREFFSSTEEWHPLFKELAASSSVPAMTFLSDDNNNNNHAAAPLFDFDNNNTQQFNNNKKNVPWKRLNGIPSEQKDKEVLASVLDSMHQSLVEIPVDEATEEDADDVHFLEEGRRMLAISRFHVLRGVHGGSVDSYDTLFATCWSELMELRVKDESSTGSLIVVPDYDLSDLRRFTDINLLRPLEWLGMHADFEVTSMHRGSPAIRLLHKLQDMPTNEPWNEPPEDDEESESA